MNTQKLFSDFAAQTKAQWEAQVAKDLKGAATAEDLVWQTPDGLEIAAYRTAEDQTTAPDGLYSTPKNWRYRECIAQGNAAETNAAINEAFEAGAQECNLSVADLTADYAQILKGIALKNQPIYLTTSHEPYAFVEYLKRTNPSLSALKGGFCFDPLANYLSKGTKIGDNIEALAAIFEAASDAKQWNVVHVGGHHFHEAGASVVQELAFTLASLVEYWHKLTNYEVSLGALATRTEISLSVGTHYFVEIAKLRAMRLLLNRVGEGFNVPTQNVGIHAQTSAYTFSEADTDTNLLRHTTEAMSAVIGGADSLSIAPHQSQPLGFAKRIARNISTLLREESYFDRVADAAAGSYYVENLTDTLAQKAWELFQEVEAQGGLIFAFEKDFLQKQIAENQAKHAALWQEKKWVMVGHNKYTKGDVPAADKTEETPQKSPRLILPHTLPSL